MKSKIYELYVLNNHHEVHELIYESITLRFLYYYRMIPLIHPNDTSYKIVSNFFRFNALYRLGKFFFLDYKAA